MSDNLNNDKIDFYRNQISQNQSNRPNMVLRQERREASFAIDKNFLESSLNKFLEQNFQRFN